MSENKDKENRILNILTQAVEGKITIGETEYQLYPISLGKLALLMRHEDAVKNLMNLVSVRDKEISDDKAREALLEAIDGTIEIFYILISPNDGSPPKEIPQDEKDKIRWQLTTANAMQIMLYLQTAHMPGDLLKNVGSPRESETEDGEILSA